MEVVTAPPPGAESTPRAEGQTWLVPLVVLIIGMFATVLDTTIVNVALPHMTGDLGTNSDDIEWVVTAYTLALGVVVPIVGWLSDRIGLSLLYIISIAGFAVFSALCGMAWDLNSEVAFRIMQAIPGGVLPVITVTMIYRIVPPEKMGTAMGLFGFGVVLAPAIGPTLGGWLIEHFEWRLIYYINVPIGIIGAIAAAAVFPRIRPTNWPKFDALGFLAVASGLFATLLAMSKGQKWGWTSYPTLIMLVFGALSLATFVVIELEVEEPILNVRVFKNRVFSNAIILIIVVMVGMQAVLFYLPQFMQDGQGLSALNAGMTLLPEAGVLLVMMPLAGQLTDRFGARWPAVIGLTIAAYCTWLMCDLQSGTTRETLMWWTSLRAVGLGLSMMPIMTAGMSALPPELTSAGSAWQNVAQRVSGSLGLAGLGAMVTGQRDQLMADRSALIPFGHPGSIPQLHSAMQQGTSGLLGLYTKLQTSVLATTYANVFLIAAVLSGLAIFLGLRLPTKAKATPQASDIGDISATEVATSAAPAEVKLGKLTASASA